VKSHQESKPPDIQIFNCGNDGVLRAVIKEVPSDGDCFLNCVLAFYQYCITENIKCPMFSLDASNLRLHVVDWMRLTLDYETLYFGISLLEYFNRNYGPSVPLSSRLQIRRSGQSSPGGVCFYVNDVNEYLQFMSEPGTHVDEAFIKAFSIMYQLRVQVITQARSEFRPLEVADDPKLEAFVALGVSLEEARQLLIKYQDDVNRAMDDVLLRRKPEPVVDSSKILWQVQPYGDSTETIIGLVCSSGHFQLMMKPPVYDQQDPQLRLPPRRQPQKHSAGGGDAENPHKPSPSFAHSQPQAVARPQSWQEKLQLLFSYLVICHLEHCIVRPSGEYQTNDYDWKNKLCLLSSVEFDALRTFENISAAFLYNSPNVTHLDFTIHNIVTSFLIGEKMFRCTAVVFNDGHVIGFPELKNLQKDDPERDKKRKDFCAAINSYFEKNPRFIIFKMLFEPCV